MKSIFHVVVCLFSICMFVTTQPLFAWQQPVKVELKKQGDKFTLVRDGSEYRIRGAGGEGSLEMLAGYGGNSGRLWGVDEKTEARLNEAQQNGITLAVGIWLEQSQQGFDYSDQAAVKKQYDLVIDAVQKYKNHPAVLVWGLGNEMEGYEGGDDPNVWNHVESLAKKIKEIDPNHPTMTVVAEIKPSKIAAIHKHCPSLDIIGVNSYGGATSLFERYLDAGGKKPVIVTEFGPVGTWEVPKNEFGAIVEPTSSSKIKMYSAAYQAFEKHNNLCLGSYAFLWGDKQEATETWFGMLTPDGKKTEAVDRMSEFWKGRKVSNPCPVIESIELSTNKVKPGEKLRVTLKASDPMSKPLKVHWKIRPEAGNYNTGGHFQETPEAIESLIESGDVNGATILAPKEPGIYRCFVQVDNGDGAANANVVFLVETRMAAGSGEKLPYVVYDEPGQNDFYAASGWMGNAQSIRMTDNCTTDPKSGHHCLKVEYKARNGWGGVVWQNPPDDWGDRDGGKNFTGAKRISFWAKGERGNEKVKFGLGLLGRDKKFYDTTKKEKEFQLKDEWTEYSFDVSDADLSRIKTPFFWTLAAQNDSVTFYLDKIVIE